MRKTRFTEFQIIKILKPEEGGIAVKDACREHGISRSRLIIKNGLNLKISRLISPFPARSGNGHRQ